MSVVSYTKARIDALLAGAVALSTSTPAAPSSAGYAGTANSASRGDHSHPGQPTRATVMRSSGDWVSPDFNDGAFASDGNLGWLMLSPYYIGTNDHGPISVSGLGVQVTTAGSSDSVVKFGLYKALGSGLPDYSQLAVSATATTATTGAKQIALGSTVSLAEGLYWRATLYQGTTAPSLRGFDPKGLTPRIVQVGGGGIPSGGGAILQLFQTGYTTGSLPLTAPGSILPSNNVNPAAIWLGVA